MARWQAEVIGPWIVDPDGQKSKKLSRDYAGCTISDVTGQPVANLLPDPNLVAVVVVCEADVLDALEADGDYLCLWSEEIVGEAF